MVAACLGYYALVKFLRPATAAWALASVLAVSACTPAGSADSASGPEDLAPRDCGYEPPPEDLVPATLDRRDSARSWRVVQLPSDVIDTLYAVVYFPTDPELRAYEDGAPVMVGARPALFSDTLVTSMVPSAWGIVEVQPVYPGWVYEDYASSGVSDAAGPLAAAALTEAIAFAAGHGHTVDGLSLRQLTGAPVCNGGVVVSANSSGIIHAARALVESPDLLDEMVLALVAAESPHLPQAVVGDLGFTHMDPDHQVDADGNGVTWDDFRNSDYQPGSCEDGGCPIDYSQIAWEPQLSLQSVFGDYYDGLAGGGLLYLDRNDNGLLDISTAGSWDLDGDGAVEVSEDWPLLAWFDNVAPLERVMYSAEATEAALELGVVTAGAWPTHISDAQQARAFWDERSLMAMLPGIIAAAPADFGVYFTFSEVDHALAQASRPHIAQPYQALLEAGVSVRYNVSAPSMSCLVERERVAGWGGQLPWNEDLGEGELSEWALPESISGDEWRALGAAGAFWEYLGPFDRCPALD